MLVHAKLILSTILIVFVVGCATPATKEIAVGDEELKREQIAQRELAKKSTTNKSQKLERKHKELSFYHKRLEKISPRLMQAAQTICKDKTCEYQFKVADENVLNAWADGKTVNITPVMMDFLGTDQELALILSHELAHNIMGHIGKKTQNALIGTIFDVAAALKGIDTGGLFGGIGAHTYSQGFENEADYVGMYIYALAGYDTTNAHNIWRKMSAGNSAAIDKSFFSSHPSNPERYLRMQKTHAEIKAKKLAGQKVYPNLS